MFCLHPTAVVGALLLTLPSARRRIKGGGCIWGWRCCCLVVEACLCCGYDVAKVWCDWQVRLVVGILHLLSCDIFVLKRGKCLVDTLYKQAKRGQE